MNETNKPLELQLLTCRPGGLGSYVVEYRVRVAAAVQAQMAAAELEFLKNGEKTSTGMMNSSGIAEGKLTLDASSEDPVTLQARIGTMVSNAVFVPPDSAQDDLPNRLVQPNPAIQSGERVIVASGVYMVTKPFQVHAGGHLILRPGVTLRFGPEGGVVSRGKITARGDAEHPVSFLAFDAETGWAGFLLDGKGAAQSEFASCLFQNAGGTPRKLPTALSGYPSLDRMGGALLICDTLLSAQSAVTIHSVAFRDNKALRGGGLAAVNAKLDLGNAVFEGNHAEQSGGGFYAQGAIIQSQGGLQFKHNEALVAGGGMALGHEVSLEGLQPEFTENTAPKGSDVFSISNRSIRDWTADKFTVLRS